jgi:hypothetical protein
MNFTPLNDFSPFDIFFIGFTSIQKLDFFFNKRYQTWVYNNSHKKDEAEKEKMFFLLKHDARGNITNAKFSGTTMDGIPLTEKDYIKLEFINLNTLFSYKMTFDEHKRVEYYRDFLEKKTKEEHLQKEDQKIKRETYPYPEVFRNSEAHSLFERLYNSKKDTNNHLADFSFIYRRMYKDDLLQDHQKPEVFRKWLSKEPYIIVLDNKFKTLNNCTTQAKEESYHNAKLLIQKQTE